MPELPEVETVCRQLNAIISGKKITKVEVLDRRLGEEAGLAGWRIAAVARRGKAIEIRLDDGGRARSFGEPENGRRKGRQVNYPANRAGNLNKLDEWDCIPFAPTQHSSPSTGRGILREEFIKKDGGAEEIPGSERHRESDESSGMEAATVEIHLRMTGRLLWQTAGGPLPPHARLVVTFPSGRLLLIDPRRFATCRVRMEAPPAALIENPLTGLPAGRLREIARGRRLPVKSFLMDQRLVAGIGNIYACEILHEAAVDPRRPAGSLSPAEWRRVERAAAVILPRAVDCRGTTVSDWRDLFGASGENQHNLRVYAREGESCPRCGGRIGRMKLAGRGTWFCPACQK